MGLGYNLEILKALDGNVVVFRISQLTPPHPFNTPFLCAVSYVVLGLAGV